MAHARKWMISKQYAYKISKTALNALTVQYAYSLEEEGFGVFSICPGVSFSPENSASASDCPTYPTSFPLVCTVTDLTETVGENGHDKLHCRLECFNVRGGGPESDSKG